MPYTTRNNYLDYLKGILIILITFAHAMQYLTYSNSTSELYMKNWDDRLFDFICIFDMPLFIAVSGYFTFFSINRYSFREYALNRFLFLFIPMVSWSFVHAVIQVSISGNIVHLFAYAFTDICRVYWFIWAIILHSMFIGLLNKLKMDNIYVLLGTLLISAFIPSGRLPYVLPIINTMYPFFVLGYIIASKKLHEQVIQNKSIVLSMIVASFVLYLFWDNQSNYYINSSGIDNMGFTLYRLLGGTFISVAVAIAFYYIYKKVGSFSITGFLIQAGKNSLTIYLAQMMLINIITTYFYNQFYINESLLCIIPTLIFVIVINMIVHVLSKNKYTSIALLGKKQS